MKKLIIMVIVILLVLFLAKDYVADVFLTFGINSFTNLSSNVGKVRVGIFESTIDIKDFKLYNPRTGFKDRVMIDIPELYIKYDLGSLLSGTKHLEAVRLNLKELVVVKNDSGELNLNSLRPIETKATQGGEQKQDFKFKIDVLELKVGRVIYKDYSGAGDPVVKEFNIGLDERYTNITDPYSFASLVIYKALVNTSIANLANFDLGPLRSAASEALISATKTATDAVTEAVKTGGQAAKEAVSKGTEAVKELLPFGK